jgi:hypothetical protein
MTWADSNGISYIAFNWWDKTPCTSDISLLTNYNGTPSAYGQGVHDHYLGLPAQGTWSIVHQANVQHSGSASIPVTIAATAAANTLVISIGSNGIGPGTPSVSTITDNGATHAVYAQSVGRRDTSLFQDAEIWSATNIPAGITQLTVTLAGAPTGTTFWVGEVANLAPSSPVDGTASQLNTGTSHGTGTTGTTTATNDFVVAVYADAGYGTTITVPAGWTQDLNTGSSTIDEAAVAHENGAMVATYSATFTTGAATNSAAAIAAFKPRPATNPALTISNVAVSNIANTSATITWTTSNSSNSRVDYGTTTSYGAFVTNASNVTSHSLNLTGLTTNTVYHYKVTSVDVYGQTTSSADATFTTSVTITGATCQVLMSGVWKTGTCTGTFYPN